METFINFLMLILILLYVYFRIKDQSSLIFDKLNIKMKNRYVSLKQMKLLINKSTDNDELIEKLIESYNFRIKSWICLIFECLLFMFLIFYNNTN